jgi:hypothetical protein
MDTATDPAHPDCQYRIDDPRTPDRKTYVDDPAWVKAHPEEARKKWLWLTSGGER